VATPAPVSIFPPPPSRLLGVQKESSGSIMVPSRLDFSHGVRFSAKVRAALGTSVVSHTPDDASSFWLIASFSHSKLRLDSDSVS
jgi:hypothetical protein